MAERRKTAEAGATQGNTNNTETETPKDNQQDKPPSPFWNWIKLHVERLKQVGLHEWLMVAATIVMAGSTFAYTQYARWQLRTMQETLAQMKESGSVGTNQVYQVIDNLNWTARSMQRALDENRQSAEKNMKQSKAGLDASIAASRTDQRAWVGILNLKLTKDPIV